MKFKELEEIIQRLRVKPVQTLIILITVILVTFIGSYVLTYINEMAKNDATSTSVQAISASGELKHALAELSGRKRALARLLKENAEHIDIHVSGAEGEGELKWSPRILIRTLDSINVSMRNVVGLAKDTDVNISLRQDALINARIHEEMTLKQALHESLDEKIFNLSLRPPEPNDFLEASDKLSNEADELDRIIDEIKIE